MFGASLDLGLISEICVRFYRLAISIRYILCIRSDQRAVATSIRRLTAILCCIFMKINSSSMDFDGRMIFVNARDLAGPHKQMCRWLCSESMRTSKSIFMLCIFSSNPLVPALRVCCVSVCDAIQFQSGEWIAYFGSVMFFVCGLMALSFYSFTIHIVA